MADYKFHICRSQIRHFNVSQMNPRNFVYGNRIHMHIICQQNTYRHWLCAYILTSLTNSGSNIKWRSHLHYLVVSESKTKRQGSGTDTIKVFILPKTWIDHKHHRARTASSITRDKQKAKSTALSQQMASVEAILNKARKMSRTNRKWTNDNDNRRQQKHHIGTTNNNWTASSEYVSSNILDQVWLKPVCSATASS